MQGPVAERLPKSATADFLASLVQRHSYLVIIGQPRESNSQGSALRPDLALAASKCIIDFVLRNMTLYEERRLFVFLETCHFERSWLSAFGRIEVMLEGVKYFSFLFCFWGKNTKVKLCWR